jgi:hypothetical protein
MLSIVHAETKFLLVYNNHKPLEMIFSKAVSVGTNEAAENVTEAPVVQPKSPLPQTKGHDSSRHAIQRILT